MFGWGKPARAPSPPAPPPPRRREFSHYANHAPSASASSPLDPRTSSGSLGDGYYDSDLPPAPPPPRSAHHTPYASRGPSPNSSTDNLGYYPSAPGGYPPPPPLVSPPINHGLTGGIIEPRAGGMRGGDVPALTRRSTTATARAPPAIHQQEYDYDGYDYRSPVSEYAPAPPGQRPIIHRASRSSSHSRDLSPDDAQFMIVPQSGRGNKMYHPGGSQSAYSDSSSFGERQQKGYVLQSSTSRSGRHRRSDSREYYGAPETQYAASTRTGRDGGTIYHPSSRSERAGGVGPPRRRDSRSGGNKSMALMDPRTSSSHLDRDDSDIEDNAPPTRRMVSSDGAGGGAIVKRSRSRSASAGPHSSSGALIKHEDGEASTAAPTNGSIRVEYGNGQAIDIAYEGAGGKALIGNITINTTARTVSLPDQNTPQSATSDRERERDRDRDSRDRDSRDRPTLRALPPAESSGPPPPPPTRPILSAPSSYRDGPPSRDERDFRPPPGSREDRDRDFRSAPGPPPAPGPPRRGQHPDSFEIEDAHRDARDEHWRQQLYDSMIGLSLHDSADSTHIPGSFPSPPMPPSGPVIHDDPRRGRGGERGADRDIMPPPPRPTRRRSSRSLHDDRERDSGPLWTKISRDIVSKRAVLVRNYEFEEAPGHIIIYRVLQEPEIDDLVNLSERIRSGKVEVVRKDRKGGGGRPQSMSGGYPGPSRERPQPRKPAIVNNAASEMMPEAPSAPGERMIEGPPPPPVRVTQTRRDGLREDPEMPGTYIGYTRNPTIGRGGGDGGGSYRRH